LVINTYLQYNYRTKIFTRRAKPIRITSVRMRGVLLYSVFATSLSHPAPYIQSALQKYNLKQSLSGLKMSKL